MITIARCPSLILVSAFMLVIVIVPMLAIGLLLSVVAVAVLRDRGPSGQSADHSRKRECECNPADTKLQVPGAHDAFFSALRPPVRKTLSAVAFWAADMLS
jgi:hypothetical protein